MGKAKKTRKFAQVKRMVNKNDERLGANPRNREALKAANKIAVKLKAEGKGKKDKQQTTVDGVKMNRVAQVSSQLFFRYNTALGPPYRVLIDTNFINFSIQNKLDIFTAMMDCLLAKCIPMVTDCVLAELEKLGQKYRVALRIAKDPRFERIPCAHKGTYADDCLVNRVTQHKCYIVATCDKDLKRRIRKIPGVPIMYIAQRKFSIESFPDVNNAPST